MKLLCTSGDVFGTGSLILGIAGSPAVTGDKL